MPLPAQRCARALVVVIVGLVLSSCGIPRDPDGTLDRIKENKVVHAGASHHPPYVDAADDGDPSGTEVELVEAYAEHLGADVEWTVESETALVEALDAGEIDLIVAGLDEESLFADEVGFTRPYLERTEGPEGDTKAHVIGVRMGENGLLADLERWLDANEVPAP